MGKPYDATGKELLQSDPVGWASFLGVIREPNRIRLIDSELSTITAAADKVLKIEDSPSWILDIEFQSSRDTGVPQQLLKYNALLQDRHKLPVASVLIVLTEDANSRAYTGTHLVSPPFGLPWEFRYTIVKVWELSAESLLSGPLGLVPLAPVANVAVAEVPNVIRRVEQRLQDDADVATRDRFLTAVGILLQLRYGAVTTQEFLREYPEVRDFAFFKTFRDEGHTLGRIETLQDAILRMGRKKFGPPLPEQDRAIRANQDGTQLEVLSDRILDVASWNELLLDRPV